MPTLTSGIGHIFIYDRATAQQTLGTFYFAAQGLHGLQGFTNLEAQGLHGLQGLQAFAAHGLHGLQGFTAFTAVGRISLPD